MNLDPAKSLIISRAILLPRDDSGVNPSSCSRLRAGSPASRRDSFHSLAYSRNFWALTVSKNVERICSYKAGSLASTAWRVSWPRMNASGSPLVLMKTVPGSSGVINPFMFFSEANKITRENFPKTPAIRKIAFRPGKSPLTITASCAYFERTA